MRYEKDHAILAAQQLLPLVAVPYETVRRMFVLNPRYDIRTVALLTQPTLHMKVPA